MLGLDGKGKGKGPHMAIVLDGGDLFGQDSGVIKDKDSDSDCSIGMIPGGKGVNLS
jgi:hypothetical protein